MAPHVVFEIVSPDNRAADWVHKFAFYQRYGVEEYYIYDPDTAELLGYRREGDRLVDIPQMLGWISPRLKCRFDIVDGELQITTPTGRRFVSFEELGRIRDDLERQIARAGDELARAQDDLTRANDAAQKLREQLRAHGIEPQS